MQLGDTHYAHGTAIALRVLDLRQRFPEAAITTRINDSDNPADIAWWNCAPGEVWVWEFRHAPAPCEPEVVADPTRFLAAVRADPRSRGRAVVPGPNRAFSAPADAGANMATYRELITVRSAAADGLQFYERHYHQTPVARDLVDRTREAIDAASDANAAACL
ncbi:hypothetical protein [Phytohabitans aurantiacus]|uniref:Uncharacterized protein n=1 Tax=Phytohabitans aurantiacus TaxID=3016789 RepID=A0ABQ5R911_9ACTN|nr:hypothetical protein [Phytohabitans aurantiacus]GLI02450.1 hypothetical protein Pa4123_77280 [Phytohabitans aurantiacus]